MGMKFKKGDPVVQVTNPIRGMITSMIIRDDEPVYLVGWTDANGDVHERPFSEEEIEAAKVAETVAVEK